MRVKVWNDNNHELKELFKGDKVSIPAKGFIEMEFYEAHEFKGQYHPQPVDNDGKLLQDSKYFKIIRIEPIDGTKKEEVQSSHVCMQCKHMSPSSEELEAHVKVRHSSAARLELPAEDEVIAAKKRGPGRPPKDAVA